MNRLSKCLFLAAASVAMTGVAFADDPPPPAGGGADAGASAGAGVSVGPDGAAANANVDVAVSAGVFTAATWPTEYVLRPQNLYKGGIEISPRLDVFYRAEQGMVPSSTVTALNVGGRYGVTDNLEILAAFDRIILTGIDNIESGDRVKGVLTAGAGIGVAKGQLDVEIKAAIQYDLGGLGFTPPIFLLAGADVRFHLTPKMWIGTPINRPGIVFGITNAKLGDMEIPDSKPFLINIPLAFAFQATPALAFQVNTDLLRFNLNDAAKGGPTGKSVTFLSQDEHGGIPLDFDVIFALSNKMDVQVKLDLGDVKDAGDVIDVVGGVNIRL